MKVEDFQENYGNGWIKLYRSIKNHWILEKTKPLTFFEAWVFILLEVNHSGQELRIGYDILKCERGESLNSLDTWAKIFHWHKSKVRRFFKLLEKDSMIELKKCDKSTHLKVCNYETYQGERNASETQVKRKRNASETQVTPNKNVKNEKNVKNINNIIDEIYKLYPTKCPVKNGSTGKSSKDKDKIKQLLKTNSPDLLKKIITWYIKDCEKSNTYMKNFKTFLNNLPDIDEPKTNGEVKYRFTFIGTNHTFNGTKAEFKNKYPDMLEKTDYEYKRI